MKKLTKTEKGKYLVKLFAEKSYCVVQGSELFDYLEQCGFRREYEGSYGGTKDFVSVYRFFANRTMIDEKELSRVEDLAKKATQGTWMIDECHLSTYGLFRPCNDPQGSASIVDVGEDREERIEFGITRFEDAEYIAAVHPEFVLKLIAALRNK